VRPAGDSHGGRSGEARGDDRSPHRRAGAPPGTAGRWPA
jgi:hypothetical protein